MIYGNILTEAFVWPVDLTMASTVRAKQIVEGPLPQLQVGPFFTKSNAIQQITYTGALVEWSDFLGLVESKHLSQRWERTPRTSRHANGPHTFERERIHIGDEQGLHGRFQQAIGHALGAVLEAKSVDLYFGDFKCSGSKYPNTPDIVALQNGSDGPKIKLVGELKVPWVEAHDLQDAIKDEFLLRRIIAQPVRDMQGLDCEYGFISTYKDTVFLRQFQSPGGEWVVWRSPLISSSAYYVPRTSMPQVSMKQCMFYVCSLASVSSGVVNNTKDWIKEL